MLKQGLGFLVSVKETAVLQLCASCFGVTVWGRREYRTLMVRSPHAVIYCV